MPRCHGNLFDKTFTIEALYQAYLTARKGKRKTAAVATFEQNLGANINQLHKELHSGTYRPKDYRTFWVTEPKRRLISAPAFRDVVVQHAIYAVINPIFDAGFVFDSYGCRVGKGTHKASDRVQQFMRSAKPGEVTLQLDIRKFYYSIDRTTLRRLIERKIKDVRYVDSMMAFADDGGTKGVPIGNLLSQLYALIYLNPLDHFIKRELKAKKYVRYVDDFILWCDGAEQARHWRDRIIAYLDTELGLELSRWRTANVSKGVNFVGFRTWSSRRFVRKHSIYSFTKSLKRGDVPSATSIMGNALRTASFAHLCRKAKDVRPDLIPMLPLYKEQST